MIELFLDIETLPDQSPGAKAREAERVEAPANYKDADKIAAYKAERAEEAYRKTALNGAKGSIFCIGYAFDDEKVLCDIGSSEISLLDGFFSHLPTTTLLKAIGHNVEFDLRFIWQRAIILGVKPPANFPRPQRFNNEFMFCTMQAWAGYGNRISCRDLCEALGMPYEDEVDGSQVYDAWKRNDFASITKHCKADVERVRQIYKRMNFEA